MDKTHHDRSHIYYDRDGSPLSRDEFFRKRGGDESYWRICWTSLSKEGEYVSTVWLGIDHDPLSDKPVIFETMAYYDGGWRECRRYTNEEDARRGHEKLVAEIMARRNAGKDKVC